jgi:hypothetical protein
LDIPDEIARGATGNGAFEQSYNVQTEDDAETGIILADELTQWSSDAHRLATMLDAVVRNPGLVPDQTLSDTGYRGKQVFDKLVPFKNWMCLTNALTGNCCVDR